MAPPPAQPAPALAQAAPPPPPPLPTLAASAGKPPDPPAGLQPIIALVESEASRCYRERALRRVGVDRATFLDAMEQEIRARAGSAPPCP